MPPDLDRPHIDISERAVEGPYRSPQQHIGGGAAPRIRAEHGAILRAQLRASFQEVTVERERPDFPEGLQDCEGAYYEIELQRGAKAENLERKRDHITVGATKIDSESERVSTVAFIPDEAIPVLEEILEDYATGDLTPRGEPQRKAYIEPIESIRRARLYSFWTDTDDSLPEDGQETIWWEIWCDPSEASGVVSAFENMECRIADIDHWLHFPETMVIPVLARRANVELALIITKGISELRRGTDTPTFFIESERDNQQDWINDLAERIVWPSNDVPRVCLLDTGVNRAHPLLEPAISESDLMAVNPDWGVTDNVRESHGTEMAGLALHGDLFHKLQDTQEYSLTHRLESVRIMPPNGFDPNEPARFGSITLSGVALAEISSPDSERVFCLAVTNEDRSGDRASSWSSCIDRAAAGQGIADEGDNPKRLFCISGGNIRNALQVNRLREFHEYSIEDPAQAWNALTVGGYTDKTDIDEDDPFFWGYSPVVAAGDVSPFTRNSTAWRSSKTPIKPEIMFEAGNRAVSDGGNDLIDCPSLELVTTGAEVDRLPLVNFSATSAATAQAARLAARLQADHPEYWPETIRALMVHSAEWTSPMLDRLANEGRRGGRKQLVRTFGYGVPSYQRATASANDVLALVAQKSIQPFRRSDNGYAIFNECHYYPLPWPQNVLEEYGDEEFEVKLTLSYFIEPNPGKSAAIDPQKYQSYGLRFDLKRPLETLNDFLQRNNANERSEGSHYSAVQDSGSWLLGPSSISAGSLHCDVWRGTGAQLSSRNIVCVKPVSGWWKERRNPEICQQRARYSLIVTLKSPDAEIDLYTPIRNAVEQQVAPEIPITV